MVTEVETEKDFKQTEVGLIPSDWNVFKIQDLIDEKIIVSHLDGNHGELYPRSNEFVDFGVPYVGANDFVGGEVSFANCKFLSEERAKQFRKGIAINGDVLFAHNATVGPVAFLKTNLDYVILSTTATYFRCNKEKLRNRFLLYALQSSHFVRQYKAVMAQSTRFQVPITTQRKFYLVLPSIEEQTSIATALSDADALITSLEKLIAKKQNIKQGAMQKLLQPKEGWVVKKLPDVVYYIHGKAHERDIVEDGKYIVVNSKFISSEGEVVKYSNVNYCPARTNDVLTVLSDLPNGKALSKCYYVNDNNKYAVNQRICIWRTKRTDSKFLFYILNRNKYFLGLDDGVSQTHILNHHIEKCQIAIPNSPKEQQHIATILSDMDAEIEKLQQQLTKYKMIKQGMMQNLLTGKIRLV